MNTKGPYVTARSIKHLVPKDVEKRIADSIKLLKAALRHAQTGSYEGARTCLYNVDVNADAISDWVDTIDPEEA